MKIDADALALETWMRVRRSADTEISVNQITHEIAKTIREVIRIQNDHVAQVITAKLEQNATDLIEAIYTS